MRVLILGGTREARDLAQALVDVPGTTVTTSLAGRVRTPALPAGETVIGGFGGVAGLRAFLAERAIDAVVDATHPYAATISAHAAQACQAAAGGGAAVPLFRLARPGWSAGPGDAWHRVRHLEAAAEKTRALCPPGGTVFVTTGRRELAPFAGDAGRHYLIRAVDPPTVALPPRHTVLLDRGPYTVDGETRLMRDHAVRLLVTKDSGGPLTRAKLDAARALRVPVVMVDRPAAPGPGPVSFPDADGVLAALRALGARAPGPAPAG